MIAKNYIYTINQNQMKNKVLLTVLICLSSFATAWAQTIPNYSFETWASVTNYLDLTLTTPNTLDTTISQEPVSWTTSNEITNGNVFHHKVLVTQSASSYVGSSAIQLRSDSLYTVINGTPFGAVPINFVCPGFAVCGRFPINLTAFVNLGTAFNPALLAGAGIPIANRVGKIGGYLKYTPVGGDTAYVVAVLRKGSTVVAQATYKRATTDAAYTYFEAPFVYVSCLEPDTMVYTISSGNPYSISGVVLGTPSGLHIGSTLLADSVFLGDTLQGFGIAIPANDAAQTLINTPVSIPVTNNDVACTGGTFILGAGLSPRHGSASISGYNIIYTPNTNFLGMDTFTYAESIGTGSAATAQVIVTVTCGPAIPRNDTATTYKNTSVHIVVTANDAPCAAGTYSISQGTAPRHGTITVFGDTIIYTPTANYIGIDTFTYTETIGGSTSGTAEVIVYVNHPLAITDVTEGKTAIYPNPASTRLHVITSDPYVSELHIYDMLGKVMKAEAISTDATIDVSNFSNGLYIIQFSSTEGKMISSTRFTVIK
jgi:hypothetical protein